MTISPAADFQHRTVLLDAAVAALAIADQRCGGRYLDGTFGRGGHSRAILRQLGAHGRLLAIDKDPQAIAAAAALDDARFAIAHGSFAEMSTLLERHGWTWLDGVLLDLGISSPQVDDAGRGFSFRADGPLDMRMDTTRGMSAAEWLASAPEQKIEKVIRDYGEERFAFQIAKAIAAGRAVAPISGTRQLAELVAGAVKTREKGKDPATRTFQAIRIFINQELEELQIGLERAFAALAPGGRLVVISFHSLEDRMVKQFIASKIKVPQPPRGLPVRAADLPQPQMKLIGRVKPSADEIALNPRARSAVMRIAERLADAQPKRVLQ